jgi:hypothetical protein
MGIGSILIIAAVAILAGALISQPLWEGAGSGKLHLRSSSDTHRSALLAEKDRVLKAIQELDFDHIEGKVTDGDYAAQRASLVNKGSAVLRDLETISTGEAEKVHKVQPVTGQPAQRDEIEEMIASHRGNIQSKAAGFCPQCGRPVGKDDLFCPRCGTKL